MLQTSNAPLITRADYEDMPQGPPYYQVIEGDLIMWPAPDTFHQSIAGRLHGVVWQFLEKHPVGEVFIGPLDVFLTEVNVYQPDVIFISNKRRSIITKRGLEGAPDLVVEVLSPGTARFDKGSKRKIYARMGVSELWLVDPIPELIHVYHLSRNAEVPVATYDAKATLKTPLLPGLRIRVGSIFKRPFRE